MGALLSVQDLYTFGEPFESNNNIWEISLAVRKSDEEAVTVFVHDKEKQENSKVERAIKYIRTLRHPGLLKCLEVFDEYAEVAVVTEPVVPLAQVLEDLYLNEVIAGIHNIIVTLAFLHEKCQLSHNNLALESIFVGQNDACWKIAGFEDMCAFSELGKEKSMREGTIAHAKDVLALGQLISDILEQLNSEADPVIVNFQRRIQDEILEKSLEKRPQVSSLLSDEIFQNGYCQILNFLKNITMKSSAEKDSFFRTLHERLHELPSHVVAYRLLHLLLSRFVLVDPVAVEMFLPHLLTPKSDAHSSSIEQLQSTDVLPLLPGNLYRECCIPILGKLFEVNDRHVRLILLKYFHLYVGMFDKSILRSDIVPELRLGLQDSDDELVSATFSALQYLVPLVGADAVIGGERVQQFTERRPKIDAKSLSVNGLEPSSKPVSSSYVTSKIKPNESLQNKIKERERRREETRRRNEERRKQRQLEQIERKFATKTTVAEQAREESGDEFDSWDNFDGQEKELDRGEISDSSEHGRPSSSEISIDSGFSEKPRQVTEQLTSPGTRQEPKIEVNKEHKPKSFGMKLGKKAIEKSKKNSLEDTRSKIENKKNKLLVETNNDGDIKQSIFSSDANATLKQTEAKTGDTSSSKDASYETLARNDFSSNSTTKSNKNMMSGTKTIFKPNGSTNERLIGPKKKTISPQRVVDTPWDGFGIKVTQKDGLVDDIFADMAPTISETRKAPVKGTSMYSEKLAVAIDPGGETTDGWLDEDW